MRGKRLQNLMEEKDRQSHSGNNVTDQSRRAFLRRAGATAVVSILGMSQAGSVMANENEFCPIRQTHSEEKILEGTKEEVTAYINESQVPGPTTVVVGGVQGNEPAGWHTAHAAKDWSIDSGKLVVLPEINPIAIRRGTYINDNGDLNDQFPPNRRPTTRLARALWDYIADTDPDVFFSLHTSRGILHESESPAGVGQAIYPTYIEGARADTRNTVQYMNQRLDSWRSIFDFKVGNTLYGIRPLLTHKVASDLQIPGFLIETTRYRTTLDTRVKWEQEILAHLLYQNGMKVKE